MNIAIIGAGFTGLSAAYAFSKEHNQVTVFESANRPGGLAVGFSKKQWDWQLEAHYHHWFTNDRAALTLARELGIAYDIIRPKTSVLVNKHTYQLDSISSVLSFPALSPLSKLRMLVSLGLLKINPFWQTLDIFSAHNYLRYSMGNKSYATVWEPQLANKFDTFYKDISLAWFWARIKKRTPSLAYPRYGFSHVASLLVSQIEAQGNNVLFNTRVIAIESRDRPMVTYTADGGSKKTEQYDVILWTAPLSHFIKTAKNLPIFYRTSIQNLKTLGAVNVVFRLKQPFLQDGTYWLSICHKNAPVMAIVEHTNFINKEHYAGEHIVYVGNYMSLADKRYSLDTVDYLRLIDPLLSSINQSYKQTMIGYDIFHAPFAQPVVPVGYRSQKPDYFTPLPNVFTATMQHIYPWDRGTNYAIELGNQVAHGIMNASL